MPSIGGRYEIRDGKRVLTHQTKAATAKPAKAEPQTPAAAPAKTEAPKPAKAAAKQEVKGNE